MPEAWAYEHNVLHHSHTGEEADPDLLERNTVPLRTASIPKWLRVLALFALSLSWRAVYYAPQTLDASLSVSKKQRALSRRQRAWLLWSRCYLPYAGIYFGLLPLLFLPLGRWAALSVLINSVLADVLTSVHTFVVVGPNHTGDDLYRFRDPPASRAEHYVRQVIGSVNYRVGGDLNDFAHLWLNYQIEHHLFPDIPMLRYREVQPKVVALCARFEIPYAQQSVWRRVAKLVDVSVGNTQMRVWPSAASPDQAPSARLPRAPVRAV